jgi:plasmid stabilization system protein ParE
MSLPVVLRRAARAEFDDAIDWYENQRSGLGVVFADRVQDVLDRISDNPQMHAPVFRDVRKAIVRRFPYCVYYRVEPDVIVVWPFFTANAIQ